MCPTMDDAQAGSLLYRKKMHMSQKPLMKEEMVGANVGFDRIRRITGYLVGTTDRFNDAKRAEEKDRVKHGI